MIPPIPPFTGAHRDEANRALRQLQEAKELIDKAKRCGRDCSQDEQLASMIGDSLEGYRREFLEPGPPAP
jgi:hypothetical protein